MIIKELVLKGAEMGEGGVKLTKMQCCRQTMVKCKLISFACLRYYHIISYESCKYWISNKQELEQSIALKTKMIIVKKYK